MNRLARRVAWLEARMAAQAAGTSVVEILEAGRRAHKAGEYVPRPKPTLEELRAEMTLGGWRQQLAEARARLWYWDQFVPGAA
jgi:hypothetical protein